SPGEVATAAEPRVAISGLAKPGVDVGLRRGATFAGATRALADGEWSDERGEGFYRNLPSLSPDGRSLLVPFESGLDLQDVATGDSVRIANDVESPYWSRDGSHLLYVSAHVLYRYDVASATSTEVLRESCLNAGVELPDGNLLAIACPGGVYALWRVDLDDDSWEQLLSFPPGAEIQWETLQVAPTGRHVAYYRATPTAGFEVLDLVTKTVVALGDSPVADKPSWSPDGQSLLYTRLAPNGRVDSWRYDLGGTARQLTIGPEHRFSPQWAPDGRGFVSVAPSAAVVFEDFATGIATPVPIPIGDRLSWSRSGKLAVVNKSWWYPGVASVLTPAGWFGLDEVELLAGENRFTATAEDGSGGVSEPSPESRIVLLDASPPNLTVDELRIVPRAPVLGQPATVSVTVRNTGAAVAESELSVAVAGPQGSVLVAHRAAVGPLGSGETATLSWSYRPQLGAGVYQLVATVDPAGLITEANESDNQATRDLRVTVAGGPVLAVATDLAAYGNHQQLRGEADLFNGGPIFAGTLEWSVEDDGGVLVEALPGETIAGLDYGESAAPVVTWDTGDAFAGSYRVRARLRNGAGAVVAEATAPFAITASAQLTAEVLAERGSYVAGSVVRGLCNLRYVTGNRVFAGLVAAMRVVGPGGAEVSQTTRQLGALLPGDGGTVDATWTSNGAALGTYELQCQLRDGELALANAQTFFELLAAPPVLGGTLSLSSQAPAVGTPLVATWRVSNSGGTALAALPVTVRLARATDLTAIDARDTTVDLAPGANAGGTASFSTAELGLGSFLVVLEARPPGSAQPVTLAVLHAATVDHGAPTVEWIIPASGQVLGAEARLLVRARDGVSAVREVAMRFDGGAWLGAVGGDASAGTFTRLAPALTEGPHVAAARAVDDWDNSAETAPLPFVIDTTPPTIDVAGVEEGTTYGDPVTITFTVTDPHPRSKLATIDQEPIESGVTVGALGVHTLLVVAEDAAGNRSERAVHFSIGANPALVLAKE
ncbi:MAG TPA: CARDB domain-containing protein, partial [Thermoanaerobaculia bacterium]|nr:CARDB domain-containing protein [Thermoanaerobaculia bacterium]